MPSVADAIAQPLYVEHAGRSHALARADHVEVIAAYQDHLKLRSLQSVDDARRLLGPLAGELAMTSHQRLSVEGEFDFGSQLWLDSIKNPVNQKALLLFALRAHDRTATKALAEEIYRADPAQVARLIYGDPDPEPGDGPRGNG